jgi:TRAP-type C4-dicarboxylate transport system permease small subunit
VSWLGRLADRLLQDAAALLLLGLAAVTLAQVFSRYFFATSLPWTEELGRFLFTWVIWLGATVALRRAQHIRFAFLVERLGPPGRRLVQCLVDLLAAAFLALLVVQGWEVVQRFGDSTYIAIPWLSVRYAYLVTVVLGGAMLVIQLAALTADVRALWRGAPGTEGP